MSPNSGSRAADYNSHITCHAVFICIMAGTGGVLFGYDLGEFSFAAKASSQLFCSAKGS